MKAKHKLAALIAMPFLAMFGCPALIIHFEYRDNYTDRNGKFCNEESETVWRTSDVQCYRECVRAATSSRHVEYNTTYCVKNVCGAVLECR